MYGRFFSELFFFLVSIKCRILTATYTVFREGGLLKRKGEVKKEYSLEKKGLKGRYVHKCSKIKGLNVQRAKHFKGPKGSEGLKRQRVKGPKGPKGQRA